MRWWICLLCAILIAVEIVVYIVLTTSIFVQHKKMALQEQETVAAQTTAPDAPSPPTIRAAELLRYGSRGWRRSRRKID